MKRNSRAYILIQVMVVLAALLSLLAIMAADEHASNDAVQARLDQRRADAAAKAAVERAMCVLSTANTSLVTLNDDWALQGTGGDDEFTFQNSMESYRMQIVDAGSLINVNAASGAANVTPTLPGITSESSPWLQQLPLEQDQIDSLLDWVGNPEGQATSDGAKDQYYNGLPVPYNTPAATAASPTTSIGLTTVNELLLVDNWTAQTLYQPPTTTTNATLPTDTNGNTLPLASIFTVDSGAPNTQADGSARVSATSELRTLGIRLRRRTPTPTNFEQLFSDVRTAGRLSTSTETTLLNTVSFLPAATAFGSTTGATTGSTTTPRIVGRINLNTATQAVLETLPNLPTGSPASIVQQQSSGFQTLGQLVSGAGLTAAQVAPIADYFTIGSDTWIVRAYGQSGNVGSAVEAVVRVTNGQPQIINWDRLNTTGIPTWWDWNNESNSTIDAGAAE